MHQILLYTLLPVGVDSTPRRNNDTGDDFLGVPATGKRVAMRVMDFYRCDDVTIVENWIPIDIPHLLLQMGVDLFGRMRHQFRQHRPLTVGNWMVKDSVK